ncbi:MAG: hypothetical protein K6A65_04345 [Succinivibrionaceae bacterium]|nr:hypothetical protein [Succinivibrionaceae bacterium]
MLEQYLKNYMMGLGLSGDDVRNLAADDDHHFRLTFADTLVCTMSEGTTEDHQFTFTVPLSQGDLEEGDLPDGYLGIKWRLDRTPMGGRAALCASAEGKCVGMVYRLSPSGLTQEDFNAHLDAVLRSAAYAQGNNAIDPASLSLPGTREARENYLRLLGELGLSEAALLANLSRLEVGDFGFTLFFLQPSGMLRLASAFEAKVSLKNQVSLLEANRNHPYHLQTYMLGGSLFLEQSLCPTPDCQDAFIEAVNRQKSIIDMLMAENLQDDSASNAHLGPGMMMV